MIDHRRNEPYMNLIFPHFFRPAYDEESFVIRAIQEIKALGFNNIQLDTKEWQDFRERFDGGEPSQYVKMTEFIIEQLKKEGLSHSFLALYMNGDNLYPCVRFSPPIFGDEITTIDQKPGHHNKYWSPAAQESMLRHVKGMMGLYSDNHAQLETSQQVQHPICSMWDPIVMPSFDAEGRERYFNWLASKYGHDIHLFNKAYGCQYHNFQELTPEDYWYECKFGSEYILRNNDIQDDTLPFRMWRDNTLWRQHEMNEFFKAMQKRLKSLNPALYLLPILTQWGAFFNQPATRNSDGWDIARRGIDLYEVASYVDCGCFISLPMNCFGDPAPYAFSCENSMLRMMNAGKEFISAMFIGRYLFSDIFQHVTPAEMIGTSVANGAKGISVYGYCGFDDGGIIQRLDSQVRESLASSIDWAKRVIPKIHGQRKKEVAILFPSAMAMLEPISVKENPLRRMDLLGWYQATLDAGYGADVIHLNQIAEGILGDYRILVIPTNDCYKYCRKEAAESAIKAWVCAGGVVVHGPADDLIKQTFPIREYQAQEDCFFYKDLIIPESITYSFFEAQETIASYRGSGKSCIGKTMQEKGRLYSFGFNYGYAYVAKEITSVLDVPFKLNYQNNEFYSLQHAKDDPYQEILRQTIKPQFDLEKNIEKAVFGNGMVIVNHSNYAYSLEKYQGKKYYQYDNGENLLLPHFAVFIENESGK